MVSIENLKTLTFDFNKTLVLSIICDKCGSNDEKIFKENDSVRISKILDLIDNINE